jgi:serine/threonine protein kinase
MALRNGEPLGAYAIAAQIGVGGMGEVYRAHDTKLGRYVAIKILPEKFAREPERLVLRVRICPPGKAARA